MDGWKTDDSTRSRSGSASRDVYNLVSEQDLAFLTVQNIEHQPKISFSVARRGRRHREDGRWGSEVAGEGDRKIDENKNGWDGRLIVELKSRRW
jgi:hypothetical protein